MRPCSLITLKGNTLGAKLLSADQVRSSSPNPLAKLLYLV